MRFAPQGAFRAECTMVKQFLRSLMFVLSQSTWNGSMRRSACLEAARQVLLRKIWRQGVYRLRRRAERAP
jgi:hypothetical protein